MGTGRFAAGPDRERPTTGVATLRADPRRRPSSPRILRETRTVARQRSTSSASRWSTTRRSSAPAATWRDFGVAVDELVFQQAVGDRRRMNGIRTQRSSQGRAHSRARPSWPNAPAEAWRRGFLAGIYDAEGSYSSRILRISNTDPELIERITESLRSFGFGFAIEVHRHEDRQHRAGRPPHRRPRRPISASSTPSATPSPASATSRGRPSSPGASFGVVSIEPSGRRCRCSTSPPAPATSSPTASSATTATPAPPTSTSASRRASTSRPGSWSRRTRPELLRASWPRRAGCRR